MYLTYNILSFYYSFLSTPRRCNWPTASLALSLRCIRRVAVTLRPHHYQIWTAVPIAVKREWAWELVFRCSEFIKYSPPGLRTPDRLFRSLDPHQLLHLWLIVLNNIKYSCFFGDLELMCAEIQCLELTVIFFQYAVTLVENINIFYLSDITSTT